MMTDVEEDEETCSLRIEASLESLQKHWKIMLLNRFFRLEMVKCIHNHDPKTLNVPFRAARHPGVQNKRRGSFHACTPVGKLRSSVPQPFRYHKLRSSIPQPLYNCKR